MALTINRDALERLYEKFNRRALIHPDPLEFIYNYDAPRDREVVGLVASSLAYGRVRQILTSVAKVLERMEAPAKFVRDTSLRNIQGAFADFRHRFADGAQLAALLWGTGKLLKEHKTLESAFKAHLEAAHDTTMPALTAFAAEIRDASGLPGHLLPCPSAGSACKRLHLFLRWMVRHDNVDPGVWQGIPASLLIVPLDTHMHRICGSLGLTKRKQADMKAAAEITAGFRRFTPEDPVRYDFAITRLGIRQDADPEEFLSRYSACEVA